MGYEDVARTVRKAIYEGKLSPANGQKCAHCGEPAADLHHHKGYAPEHILDVIPLCKSCHMAEHKIRGPRNSDRDTQYTERVVVLLSEETKDALTRLAAKQRISVSATVRQLVAEELNRQTLPSFTISA